MKQFFKILFIIILLIIFFVGGYVYSGLQFAPPHFHANFTMFINGERVGFSDDKYSEDVAACKIGKKVYALDRTHLHDNNPDTIHVHHDGVTWGDFFANNNMLFNNSFIALDDGKIYEQDDKNKITFILNGKKIKNPFNKLINSEDRLLIDYGDLELDDLIKNRFLEVSNNAGEYNMKYDPGSCSGTHENSKISIIKALLENMSGHSH